MEKFNDRIKTEVAGSTEQPVLRKKRPPRKMAIENAIKYFNDRLSKTNKPDRKEYYYNELERVLDLKYERESTSKIVASKPPVNKTKQRSPYGKVKSVVQENFRDLLEGKVSQKELAEEYGVNYCSMSKQFLREKEHYFNQFNTKF